MLKNFIFRDVLAFRIVEAINLAAPRIVPNFKLSLSGFKVKSSKEVDIDLPHLPRPFSKLEIQPTCWPKGSNIIVFFQFRKKYGWTNVWGEIAYSGSGIFTLKGRYHNTNRFERKGALDLVIDYSFKSRQAYQGAA